MELNDADMFYAHFHMVMTIASTGLLMVATLVVLTYFCCRMAGSLPLGGPGRF